MNRAKERASARLHLFRRRIDSPENKARGDENVASERRWVFLLTVLAALVGSAIYALRQPLEFETSALVRLNAPPLPKEFSLNLGWGTDFFRSPELAAQVAKKIKITDEPEGTWPIVSWLYEHLEIQETDGLFTLKLRGGFEQRAVRDALAGYLEQTAEKLKSDLDTSLETEGRRLSDLQTALEGYRQQLIHTLERRLEEQRVVLHAQGEIVQKEIQDFLKPRLVQMRVHEQGATLESWYYRNQLEALLRRLEGVERELDLFGTRGIRAFEREYAQVLAVEEKLESLSRAQLEAQRLLEWEPLEIVTPAQLPQGPVGPDRLNLILWGTGGGVVLGLVLAIFFPRRREQHKTSPLP
jgi:uncharacterized protein involved in exopolysaccharide biosynthesis